MDCWYTKLAFENKNNIDQDFRDAHLESMQTAKTWRSLALLQGDKNLAFQCMSIDSPGSLDCS